MQSKLRYIVRRVERQVANAWWGWLAGCFLALMLTSAANASPQSEPSDQDEVPKTRPNILVVLVDDMGYSDPGFMGGEVPTPNLDRLAGNGLRFTQCYNSARCCPSRATLVTGLYPHQTGIGSFATARPDERRGPAYLGHLNNQCVTFAEVLKSAGYQTYMVGKWHMEQPGPVQRGFEEFYGFVKGYEQDQWQPERYQRLPEGREPELKYEDGYFYATDVFTDYTLEFLRQARSEEKQDKPWLIYLAHSAPHFPVQAPRETVDKLIETYRKGWDVLRGERFQRQQEIGLAQDSWSLTDRSMVPVDREDIANGYPGQPNPAWDSLPDDRREDLARRGAIAAAMTHHVDQGLGRIVADLEANGELENTLILFTSDNGACYEWGPFGFDGPSRRGTTRLHTGEELLQMGGPGTYHSYGSGWANLGNTPLRLYKHFCHEGGNCSPLVVHWPAGIEQPNRWVREPVHLMDIMPTLCEVAETNYPKKYQERNVTPTPGTSLMPLLSGAQRLAPRAIFSEHQGARSVRRGKWKLVWSKRMPEEVQWELYNIEADRCETTNLAQEYPDMVNELDQQWKIWAATVKVYPFFDGADAESSDSTQTIPEGGNVPQVQPDISNSPLKISASLELKSKQANGVILAQGGRTHGISLHLDGGQLVFSVRREGKVTATKPVALESPQAIVNAMLNEDGKMAISIDGKEVATADAGGLIRSQPQDRLTIGFDERTAVGNYSSPFPLQGVVKDFELKRAD